MSVMPRMVSCHLCGELVDTEAPHGGPAEMYDPSDDSGGSWIVHAECGIAAGWDVA